MGGGNHLCLLQPDSLDDHLLHLYGYTSPDLYDALARTGRDGTSKVSLSNTWGTQKGFEVNAFKWISAQS